MCHQILNTPMLSTGGHHACLIRRTVFPLGLVPCLVGSGVRENSDRGGPLCWAEMLLFQGQCYERRAWFWEDDAKSIGGTEFWHMSSRASYCSPAASTVYLLRQRSRILYAVLAARRISLLFPLRSLATEGALSCINESI